MFLKTFMKTVVLEHNFNYSVSKWQLLCAFKLRPIFWNYLLNITYILCFNLWNQPRGIMQLFPTHMWNGYHFSRRTISKYFVYL